MERRGGSAVLIGPHPADPGTLIYAAYVRRRLPRSGRRAGIEQDCARVGVGCVGWEWERGGEEGSRALVAGSSRDGRCVHRVRSRDRRAWPKYIFIYTSGRNVWIEEQVDYGQHGV